MESHSVISNELGEEIQDLRNIIQNWCGKISNMVETSVDSINVRVSSDVSFIRDSTVRIDGFEKRIRDSNELTEIKKVVENEKSEYRTCLLNNSKIMSDKVRYLENQLKEDKQKLEIERISYENDLKIAKQQSLDREKSCRIYGDNLGLYISKVKGNNRFTFIYIDYGDPSKEFYFDLYYDEKLQLYNGMECNPKVREFDSNIERLNSKNISFRQFICRMRRAFKDSITHV
ncbi:hypothetical protein FG386_000925 [Cryptosporidium ryanae]|uniref:uncharacterized protein n=1 Tax=Cryptosporidium ryanae TaxID=515981 RepID=UPI00351A7D3B|nr:hypothetical protein FG386_000925 [Cryptosporidium ryanae]